MTRIAAAHTVRGEDRETAMGEGFIELELSEYLLEVADGFEMGSPERGVTMQVADEGTEGLSPKQKAIWDKHVWPAVEAIKQRHQRLRIDE